MPTGPRKKSVRASDYLLGAPVAPMLATLVDEPFDRRNWVFEIKWDGYRAIAEIANRKVKLYSRNAISFADKYKPITKALGGLGHDAVLDGEVVVLDERGKPSFQLLQTYQKFRKGSIVYVVFDLLYLDGVDLRDRPLRERTQMLASLLPESEHLRVSEQIEETGVAFFQAAVEQGLEGIMAKNASSPYIEGARNPTWLKIKTRMRQEAVIGGFTRPRGSRQGFGALVLGVYEGDKLVYVGHSGSGFDERGLVEMRARLDPLIQNACPFVRKPATNMPAQWVKPVLVCEIAFQEWTDDGVMRMPIFVGMRGDKIAQEVHREVPRSEPL
jgi:bifunctional non-homologous end joining protein LigD